MGSWGDTETTTVIVFALALVTFVAAYIGLVWGVFNELIIVKRLRMCIAFLGWCLLVLYFALLYFDLVEKPRVVWPTLGFVRPIVCIVLGMFFFFTTTHPLFRWVSLLLLGTSVVCNTLATASLRINIDCRSSNTCTNREMFSLFWLQVQWMRNLADMFVGTVALLFVAALSVSMGWFYSRYPPRLFDSSVPMSFVPTSSGGNPALMMGMTAGMRDGMTAFNRMAEQERLATERASQEAAAKQAAESGGQAAGSAPSAAASGSGRAAALPAPVRTASASHHVKHD